MEHIGIDLGSKTSHICVRNEGAQIELETEVPTSELFSWMGQRKPARIVVETCTESFAIADRALMTGHEVRVVPASVVRQLGVGHRKVKNDRRDAQVLSRASVVMKDELPSVHVPSHEARGIQRVLALRARLVKSRTIQVNCIRAILRQDLVLIPKCTTSHFPTRVRHELRDDSARLSMLTPMLTSLEALNEAIDDYDGQVEALSASDPRVRRLKTIPGVGPIVGSAMVFAIDQVERFPSSAHLASYLGLTPGEHTTGGKKRFTGIPHAGKAQVRMLLIQACWSLIRSAPNSPLALRYERLAQSKPKQVAIVATARRLVCTIYAMLRDEAPFNPTLGQPQQLTTSDPNTVEGTQPLPSIFHKAH